MLLIRFMLHNSLRQYALAPLLGLAILAASSTNEFCSGQTGHTGCCQKTYHTGNILCGVEGSHPGSKLCRSDHMSAAVSLGRIGATTRLETRASSGETSFFSHLDALPRPYLLPASKVLHGPYATIRAKPVLICVLLI